MSNNVMKVEIGGSAKVYLDGEFVGDFHNVVTNACKDKILRTLVQDGSDTQIDSTHYMKYMAFCNDANVMLDPASSGISGVQTVTNVLTATQVLSETDDAVTTISGSWTNLSGAPVTIHYVATIAGALDTAASKVYSIILVTPTVVQNTQTMTVNYDFFVMYS